MLCCAISLLMSSSRLWKKNNVMLLCSSINTDINNCRIFQTSDTSHFRQNVSLLLSILFYCYASDAIRRLGCQMCLFEHFLLSIIPLLLTFSANDPQLVILCDDTGKESEAVDSVDLDASMAADEDSSAPPEVEDSCPTAGAWSMYWSEWIKLTRVLSENCELLFSSQLTI